MRGCSGDEKLALLPLDARDEWRALFRVGTPEI